jgi:uncharacterized protein (TIGR02452 family)
MKQRIRYVLAVSEKNGIDLLILGAWGCGVFIDSFSTIDHLWSIVPLHSYLDATISPDTHIFFPNISVLFREHYTYAD